MIEQLTVFLENTEGRLSALCRAISNEGIDMSALTIAEVADYGVVRIICSDPVRAAQVLDAEGFRAMTTRVLAVKVPNRPGGLADLLEVLGKMKVNIEYGYCFSIDAERAVDVLKVGDPEAASQVLREAGYELADLDELV